MATPPVIDSIKYFRVPPLLRWWNVTPARLATSSNITCGATPAVDVRPTRSSPNTKPKKTDFLGATAQITTAVRSVRLQHLHARADARQTPLRARDNLVGVPLGYARRCFCPWRWQRALVLAGC